MTLLCWIPIHPANDLALWVEKSIERMLGPRLSAYEEFLGPLIVLVVALPAALAAAVVIVSGFKQLQRTGDVRKQT